MEIKARINAMRCEVYAPSGGPVSQDILELIKGVEETEIDESFAEFSGEARRVKSESLIALHYKYESAKQKEDKDAELARLRAESEARAKEERERKIAEEAASIAKREAEEAAKQREIKLEMEAEKAKRQKLEAEERARVAEFKAQEKVRIEKERYDIEQKIKEYDDANRRNAEFKISSAFVESGLTEAQAQIAVSAIFSGNIPHVKIIY